MLINAFKIRFLISVFVIIIIFFNKQVIENPKKTKTSDQASVNVSSDSISLNQVTETTLFTNGGGGVPSSPSDLERKKSIAEQLQQSMGRNSDYEIVVMLEGNIETTGASCHIRTSYLPQEILFGYRFVPIFPKIKEFEYMFDFSKFDQVELCQRHLVHLNVDNHVNKIVYDAKREHKNCQMTFQNTNDNRFLLTRRPSDRLSISAILKFFNEEQAVKFN